MAYLDDLLTARDSLAAELAGELARRAAIVAAGGIPPISYSGDGKSVSFNEWVSTCRRELAELNTLIIQTGADTGGIYEDTLKAYSG